MLSVLVGVLALAVPSPLTEAVSSTDPILAAGAAVQALDDARHVDDDGVAVGRVLDTLVGTARHPLVRDLARRVRAQERIAAGQVVAATADLDALGGPQTIRCIGPFANTGGGAFGEPTAADDMAATLSGAVAGLDRAVRWTALDREPRGGFDIDDRFVARSEVRARCIVAVTMKQPTVAALRIASSGAVMVWQGADRRVVLRHDEDHPAGFDQAAALVALPGGKTLLAVELSMLGAGGLLDLRLTKPDGTALTGVSWSSTVPDLLAGARAPSRALPALLPPLASVTVDNDRLGRLTSPSEARAAVALLRHGRGFDRRLRPTLLTRALDAWVVAATGDERALALEAQAADVMTTDPSAAMRHLMEARALVAVDGASPVVQATVVAGLARLRERQGDAIAAAGLWQHVIAAAPGRLDLLTEALAFERRRGVLGSLVDQHIIEQSRTSHHRNLLALAADVLDERGDLDGALTMARRAGDDRVTAIRESILAEARLAIDPAARARLIDLLRHRLAAVPASHTIAERLALLLREAGEHHQARGVVEERLRRYPERPEPWRLAATMALLQGERPVALGHLQAALALTPDDGDLQRTLRTLQDVGDDGAIRLLPAFGADDLAAARTAPPQDALAPGAFIHRKSIATRFFDNGNLQRFEDIVVVIVDARRASSLRAWSWGYSGGREQVDVLVAERISRDGRREAPQRVVDRGQDGKENGAYSDARSKTALFANVDDGDVLHLRIRRETVGLQNQFGDFFGDIEVLQGPLPVRHFSMTIEGPATRPLFVGGRDAPAAVVTTADGMTRHAFSADNIDALTGEPGMPPWMEVARFISVSTYGNWADSAHGTKPSSPTNCV